MSSESQNDLLKSGNLRSTKHRKAIITVLEKNDLPLTAEELYIILKKDGVSISLSTVYRVLETLVSRGLATKCNLPDENRAVYELYHPQHRHHLLCIKCRKVIPVGGCPLEEYEKLLENRFGFTIKGHNLEIYGTCNNCMEKS